MQLGRRHLLRLGVAGGMAGLLSLAAQDKKDGIKLGVSFTPTPSDDDLAMLRSTGVQAVSIWTDTQMGQLDWMLNI